MPDPAALARVLMAAILGIAGQRAVDPDLDVDAHARALRTLIERFFRGPVPPNAPAGEGSP